MAPKRQAQGAGSSSRPQKKTHVDVNPETQDKLHAWVLGDRSTPWYNDGDILLKANGKFFRVHVSVLAGASGYFQDLVPSIEQGEKLFEGCAVLEINCSDRKLRHVLRALYKRSFEDLSRLPETVELEAWLHLATNFRIWPLRQEAIDCILDAYPPDLKTFEDRLEACCVAESKGNRTLDAMLVAFLAMDHDLDTFLPSILYACCQSRLGMLGIYQILDETQRYAKRLKRQKFTFDAFFDLYGDIMEKCYAGFSRLAVAHHDLLMAVFDAKFSPRCDQTLECRITLGILRERAFVMGDRPSIPRLDWLKDLDTAGKLCPPCHEYTRQITAVKRQEIWQRLPDIFDLDKHPDVAHGPRGRS
ncbi:hypothetical protein EWM64_g9913 [Hericium alpestre]|uniref:BTB domain-containing protein n=1 Tax=Hericium alpestre TaxID=135208 RepID=A0A4Y9ZKZ7_9AGAM|nr:hypothetical protein EWM64_g9913 [Hericium alpestre]